MLLFGLSLFFGGILYTKRSHKWFWLTPLLSSGSLFCLFLPPCGRPIYIFGFEFWKREEAPQTLSLSILRINKIGIYLASWHILFLLSKGCRSGLQTIKISDSHLFTYLFIQQIFIEFLPCTEASSRFWGYSSEQNRSNSPSSPSWRSGWEPYAVVV